MHKTSLDEMEQNFKFYIKAKSPFVLDVGSLNVKKKGCYKQVLPTNISYIGIDLKAGPNVDFVLDSPYDFPFPENYFDVVISGQCFEHAKNPFKLIKECARVLKPQGYFLGVAPYKWYIHNRPDYWRILPDGWDSLFEEAGLVRLDSYSIEISEIEGDSWGIATKS